MVFIFRILFLAFLFWFLEPSYESIYYYHFGSVTNSDALYPYLLIQDFDFSPSFASGWVTPPSHCFFPDLILLYVLKKITSDIFLIHFGFAFFCFLSVIYLIRALGFSRSVSLVGALVFLRLGEYYPETWGQFFLPSFHGTEFFLLGLCLRIIRKKEKITSLGATGLGLVIGLSIHSELWFLVHSLLPICLFILTTDHMKPRKIIITLLTSILSYGLLVQLQKQTGLGSFQPKQYPLVENIKQSFHLLIQNPTNFIREYLSLTKTLPLSDLFIPIFYIVFFLTLFKIFRSRNITKQFILPLGFFFSLAFIKISNIEPNARYFYFLPVSCITLFFFQIQNHPKITKLIAYLSLIGLIFSSNKFLIAESIQQSTSTKKALFESRIKCAETTMSDWGNLPGSSTYWPVKYLRAFSEKNIHLVPFTKEGIYYPWVHNLNWDKGLEKIDVTSLLWGIAPTDQDLLFGRKGIESRVCGDWRLIRISK
jgi:hypothetical protein